MTGVQARLAELGRPLPVAPTPLAAYVPAVRSGSLVFTAGQLPIVDGELHATGLVSADSTDGVVDGWIIDAGLVELDVAKECAAIAVLNALAAINTVASLDDVVRVVKLTGFVASVPGFTGHPGVVNGASELLGAVWGDAGRHARSAVGVANLPLNSPVEIELIVELARADG
ncbi:MAG: RidA family protein [Candidatus Nanopelagicales bacterium]